MSIRKRLITSNIAMIMIPVLAFFLIEAILGIIFVYILEMEGRNFGQSFIILRYVGLLLIITITNGLLTYYVSKSIIKPIEKLSKAAKEISDGNLNFEIEPMRKDELGELANTFEQMRVKLKESAELQMRYEENRKELLANISHDLKTPITSIKGYVEGIRDGIANTPEKMDRYIQTIYTKANDMDYLIDELFLYSKLDLQRMTFHFERINLATYFEDLLDELRFDVEKNGVSISFQTSPEDSYVVKADREQLKRVVTNMIHNSLKYMDKREKRIQVILTEVEEQVAVEIRDNGKGISEEDLPFIFDRFYRADLARNTATGGSGLGLAIVKQIIDEHGGDIWAKSKVGEGTSIFFTLRKLKEEQIENEQNTNH